MFITHLVDIKESSELIDVDFVPVTMHLQLLIQIGDLMQQRC